MNPQTALLISARITLAALLRQRTHLLIVLLALEATIVAIIIALALIGLKRGDRIEPLVFVLLTIGACEASLGLSLLVAIVRTFGNDLIKSITTHKI